MNYKYEGQKRFLFIISKGPCKIIPGVFFLVKIVAFRAAILRKGYAVGFEGLIGYINDHKLSYRLPSRFV